ncbi:SMP-30/gluconolactonase/LRE family protein [Schaalia vaccimaxillae]|uniref:SMP-30/gluconolactonase/LRE family protein n=1 Tax=Schaalia vaccimaxillae TaxID=183916 RepID=UPI0003B71EF3|nr:SMP-30/gluconolactonase/LRE family protein [Schaalia vaccimaxillae]
MRISTIIDIKPSLGEGPVWDAETYNLWWIDSIEGRIYRHDENGNGLKVWDAREKLGSMALFADGHHLLLAQETGLYAYDTATDERTLIIDPEPDQPKNRLNDGKVDPKGRFIVGSMDMMEDDPNGRLYRIDPDLSVHVLDEGIICSNGPCFSPDGSILYFADTWTGDIWAYDYNLDTGEASNRRIFTTVDTSDGGAVDGMTVDSDGFVWQAHVYGGKLNRYDPDGTLERSIEFPVRKVTCPAFGGPDLDRLYVTTMGRPPLPRFPEDGPERGSLYVIDNLGVRGNPVPRFAATDIHEGIMA